MAMYLLEENKIKVKINLLDARLQSHHKQTLLQKFVWKTM